MAAAAPWDCSVGCQPCQSTPFGSGLLSEAATASSVGCSVVCPMPDSSLDWQEMWSAKGWRAACVDISPANRNLLLSYMYVA